MDGREGAGATLALQHSGTAYALLNCRISHRLMLGLLKNYANFITLGIDFAKRVSSEPKKGVPLT
jgi:hypothetical protein